MSAAQRVFFLTSIAKITKKQKGTIIRIRIIEIELNSISNKYIFLKNFSAKHLRN